MKKIFLTLICLATLFGQAFSQEVKDRATYQMNQSRALWYNSTNAAGLAHTNMLQWRDVNFGYNLQSGSFTDSWGARTVSGLNAGGDMYMEIEGFKVAANLTLEHNRLGKCSFNTSMYEVGWDMPFFVAINSTETFSWIQNNALLSVSAASPLLLDDMLSAGLALKIQGKGATKSADPSGRYSAFDMEIAPSATFAINEENIVGLTLKYRLTPATSKVTSITGSAISAAFLQGLGSYTPRWIGGTIGIMPLKYGSSRLGANVQYNHIGDDSQWLAEFRFDKGTTTVKEDGATLGSVDKFVTGLNVQGLFGDNGNRKLNLDINYNLNYWMNKMETVIGKSNLIDADLNYTIFTGTSAGSYDFELGAGIDMSSISAARYTPDGVFSNTSVLPYVFLGKNTSLGKESSLLARLDVGYNFTAGNNYHYDGAASYISDYMYEDESYYLGRYYFKSGADVEYSFRINNLLATYAKATIGHLKPMGISGGRFMASLSVGALF